MQTLIDPVTLSAVVPVHNKAATLPRVLAWLVAALKAGDLHEVIFVADHCTDESVAILREAEENLGSGPFVIVINEIGIPSAARTRNIGIRHATGTHCLLVDADMIADDECMKSLRHFVASRAKDVVLCEVIANAASEQIWPLLVQDHAAHLKLPNDQLLAWAKAQPKLQDLRCQFVSSDDGCLDQLRAPWAIAWSSALVVPTEVLRSIEFCEELWSKGSEDLELAYRFWAAAKRFWLFRRPFLHLPHARNRTSEEQRDRVHEARMLQNYPTPEMEALCAFDGVQANRMLPILETLTRDHVKAVESQPMLKGDLSALKIAADNLVLIGSSSTSLIRHMNPTACVCPLVESAPQQFPLFGFQLPFKSDAFAQALVTGVWQLLPERLACRVLGEAQRVAKEVYFLKDCRLDQLSPVWPEQAIELSSTPYWARSHRISVSWYDYAARVVAASGPLTLFRIDAVK